MLAYLYRPSTQIRCRFLCLVYQKLSQVPYGPSQYHGKGVSTFLLSVLHTASIYPLPWQDLIVWNESCHEQNCSEILSRGFCVHISFQYSWIHKCIEGEVLALLFMFDFIRHCQLFSQGIFAIFHLQYPEVSCCSILSLVLPVVLLDVCLGNCFVSLVYLQFWLSPSSPHYFYGNKWHGSSFYHLLTVEYACPLLSEVLSLLWGLWQMSYEKHLIYKYFSMLRWNSFQKEIKRQTKKLQNSVFQVCHKPAIT